MCGLLGMMGPGIVQKDLKIIRDLGVFSQVRGMDGAGIYQCRSIHHSKHLPYKPEENFYKTSDNFSTMVTDIEVDRKTNKGDDLLSSTLVDVVMGHVRAATKGLVIDSNAHPFNFHHLVGAHNGTLRDKQYEHAVKTDSEMMFRDIHARGLETVLGELDKKSAYAITMYDRRDRSMYFARNTERTLAIAFLTSRPVMYWASDLEMLKFTLSRNGEEFKPFSFLPHKIVKIEAKDIQLSYVKEDPLAILQVTASLDTPPVVRIPKEDVPFEVKEKEEEQKILQFPKRVTTSTKAYHANCVCGKKHLNLMAVNYAQRGKLSGVEYKNGKYYCTNCEEAEVKKEVERIIG